MVDHRRNLGARGEELAAQYLRAQGLKVLERNWRCVRGELDIVARDGDCLVVVEVRTLRNAHGRSPEDSVTMAKQRRLLTLAQVYLEQSGWKGDCRIDIVAVNLDRQGQVVQLNHIKDAVDG